MSCRSSFDIGGLTAAVIKYPTEIATRVGISAWTNYVVCVSTPLGVDRYQRLFRGSKPY
jgi:hypothetical protein